MLPIVERAVKETIGKLPLKSLLPAEELARQFDVAHEKIMLNLFKEVPIQHDKREEAKQLFEYDSEDSDCEDMLPLFIESLRSALRKFAEA